MSGAKRSLDDAGQVKEAACGLEIEGQADPEAAQRLTPDSKLAEVWVIGLPNAWPEEPLRPISLVQLRAQRLAASCSELAEEQPVIKRRLRLELAGGAGGERIATEIGSTHQPALGAQLHLIAEVAGLPAAISTSHER